MKTRGIIKRLNSNCNVIWRDAAVVEKSSEEVTSSTTVRSGSNQSPSRLPDVSPGSDESLRAERPLSEASMAMLALVCKVVRLF